MLFAIRCFSNSVNSQQDLIIGNESRGLSVPEVVVLHPSNIPYCLALQGLFIPLSAILKSSIGNTLSLVFKLHVCWCQNSDFQKKDEIRTECSTENSF